MARSRNENPTSRNIALKLETYEKLDRFKVDLIGKKKNSNITYDDAINELLKNTKN